MKDSNLIHGQISDMIQATTIWLDITRLICLICLPDKKHFFLDKQSQEKCARKCNNRDGDMEGEYSTTCSILIEGPANYDCIVQVFGFMY